MHIQQDGELLLVLSSHPYFLIKLSHEHQFCFNKLMFRNSVHQQKIVYIFPYQQNKGLKVFCLQTNNEKVDALAYASVVAMVGLCRPGGKALAVIQLHWQCL